MKKMFLLTTAAALFSVAACGQGQTTREQTGTNVIGRDNLSAREQTIINVFGRLNLADDPFDNLNCWTDGGFFFRPFFSDVSDFETKPRANGDTIFVYGGTLHEGGYVIRVLLADDGKMTIAADDYRFSKDDRVEHRIIGDETLLIFSDFRTGNYSLTA
jgi:hypothetical protein